MNKSFSYYLTLLVIRLKGVKELFRQDPIDYLALRKGDVLVPAKKLEGSGRVTSFQLDQTRVTEIHGSVPFKKLLLFLHGGAFVSGPAKHHWDTLEKISSSTDYTIWLCDYPKAPECKISSINRNIDLLYKTALENFKKEDIVMMGDSVGGTLIITLTQRLVLLKQVLPSKIILISPVLDASFENPDIEELDKKDPMLSKKGVLSAKKMCRGDLDLKDRKLSPLFGDFHGFPPTYLFLAEHDITFPDQLIFCEKLNEQKVEHWVTFGYEMPHIWPLLPVMKESKIAFGEILKILN